LVRIRVVVETVEGFAEVGGQGPAALMVCSPAWIPMVACAGLSAGLLGTSRGDGG